MNEIKPCPFCGSEVKTHMQVGADHKPWSIICQNQDCECNARIPYCDTEDEAIAQWNRRTPDLEGLLNKEIQRSKMYRAVMVDGHDRDCSCIYCKQFDRIDALLEKEDGPYGQ